MRKVVLIIPAMILFNLLMAQNQTAVPDEGKTKNIYMKAVMALAKNNLNESEKYFNELTGLPENPDFKVDHYKAKSYYFLGDIYFIRMNNENALRYYRIVVEKYYNENIYSKAMYKLGRTLIISGRNKEGLEILKDYLTRYQNMDAFADNAYYWMAKAFIGLKDYHPALSTYQLILEKFPHTTLAYDIRNQIDSLEKLIGEQSKDNLKSASKISESENISQKRDKLIKEKELLEKMSRLLKVKQRLLEIKSEKVELLNQLKEQNKREYQQ